MKDSIEKAAKEPGGKGVGADMQCTLPSPDPGSCYTCMFTQKEVLFLLRPSRGNGAFWLVYQKNTLLIFTKISYSPVASLKPVPVDLWSVCRKCKEYACNVRIAKGSIMSQKFGPRPNKEDIKRKKKQAKESRLVEVTHLMSLWNGFTRSALPGRDKKELRRWPTQLPFLQGLT